MLQVIPRKINLETLGAIQLNLYGIFQYISDYYRGFYHSMEVEKMIDHLTVILRYH